MKTRTTWWLGLLAGVLVAPGAFGWSYNPDVFTVASKNAGGMETRMAGDFVLWQDMMSMQWRGYDLPARQSFAIATSGAMPLLANDSYAVWQDSMTMGWHAYELAERRPFALSLSDADGMSMRLAGRFLIFRGMMDMTLYGMDLESGEVFEIATGDIDSMSIRTAGDYVVWRTMTMPPVLGGYQLSSRQGFVLREGEIESMGLAMSDQFVAWREWAMADPTAKLYGYDLARREVFLMTSEDIDAMSLKAAGRYLVGRHMMTGVLYGFDGVSRESFEIAGNVDGMSLLMNERYAVWKDMMNMRLYAFDLAGRRLVETAVETMSTPVLSGSYVFYPFYDPGLMTSELRGFDVATGEGFPVAALASGAMMSPWAGGDYVVWTDSIPPSADTGLFGARIWKLPNDECADAVEVMTETVYPGDTSGATGTDQTDCGFDDWRDTWHEVRPPVGGDYTIDVHSEAFDTTLAVFAACTGSATACNDDANIQTTDSRLVMTLVKGKRYLIRVAGVDGSGGAYELSVSLGSCTAPPQADLTGDCRVNLEDLAVFSSQWLDCGLEPTDLCF